MSQKPKLSLDLNFRTRGWGIDVDSRQIRLTAVHNQLNQLQYKGQLVIEDYPSMTDEAVQDQVDEFLAANKVKRGDAVMVLPRNLAMIQVVEFPLEAKDNLEEVMEYQLGNFFPGDLSEYEFFPQVIGETDQLKVMIVAVKKEHLAQHFGYKHRWNLKLAGLGLGSFLMVNGLAKTDSVRFHRSKTVAFVYYADGLEILALNEGKLAGSYYFETGDCDRDDLVRHLEQSFSQARMDPNEVDHFLEVGTAQPALRAFLVDEVGIVFSEWTDMAGTAIPTEAMVGFGAAITAIQESNPLNLNMLPDNQRKRHKRLPVILAAAVLGLLGLFFLVSEFNAYRDLSKEAKLQDRRYNQVMEMMNEISTAKTDYENKVEELKLYKAYRTTGLLIKVLTSLSQSLPDDTYLTNFQVKDGSELTIQGESDDPFRTQRILSEMPFLKDVEPGNAITSGRNRDGKKRFMFKANINLEALR